MKETDDVQRLLRLKRFETPGEQYYQDFLEEFRERQRSELLHTSSRSIFAERFSTWVDGWNTGSWAMPLASAAAILLGGAVLFLGLRPAQDAPPLQAAVSPTHVAPLASSTPASEEFLQATGNEPSFEINLREVSNSPTVPTLSPANASSDIVTVGVRGIYREL